MDIFFYIMFYLNKPYWRDIRDFVRYSL